ncbi:uncharacterized protein LOC115753858 [Rhodamnia argentea]|uniref:Uncharacterized protein LOC115753858 n=1 Tax=Rhodamnia argentea TaxID=178133 RepID=A0A8B8QQ13_9MYRT|nr:uncharacterized protein LOC115753858 [Rhodamnia argentea]
MPQVDLEALGSACDGKISCETVPGGGGGGRGDAPEDGGSRREEAPPDSFLLSKDAEFDWFDRNAFYERRDSAKANSNSPAVASNPILNSPTNSNSRRSSTNFKSKASFLSLPKPQNSRFVDAKSRRPCKAGGNAGFFPKRSGSVGKSDPLAVEPSSPKVSCMGRVKSKKEANRRRRCGEPAGRSRTRLFASLRAMFEPGCRKRRSVLADVAQTESRSSRDARKHLAARDGDAPPSDSPARKSVTEGGEPSGLVGMKRFTSGRRSDPCGDVA